MSDSSPSVDPFFNPNVSQSPQASSHEAGQITIDSLNTPKQNTPAVTPNGPQILAKQGTKITFKTFAIGCGIFFGLFLLLVIAGLYSAISNPSSLSNLGLTITTVKSILLIFCILFFGLLFFVGFGFAALNGYRFFNNKEGSRIKYIIGLMVGLVVLFAAIGLGLVSYSKINAISEEKSYNTNEMLLPYLQVKKFDDGEPALPYSRIYIGTQGLPLIAPNYMDMQINQKLFDNIIAGLGQITLKKFTLDCGNGQIITNDNSQIIKYFFQGSCLYLKKGQFNVKMSYSYFDPQQGIEITKTINGAATVNIATDFQFNVDAGDRKLNDNRNEIILGTAPTKILVDAQKIFTDLGIPNIQIQWDLDGNGSIDKQDRVNFSYYYDQAKLYTAYYAIPLNSSLFPSQIWYLTRFRVNAGDVPPCELQTNKVSDNNYELIVKVDDKGTDISEYSVDIIDNQTDEIVSNLKSDKGKFDYDFPNGKNYRIRGYFTTTEGKRGSCEANELLDIGYNSYSFVNSIFAIGPNDTAYNLLSASGDDRVENNTIIVSDIPTTVKIIVDKIVPDLVSAQVNVFEDNVLKNPTKEREYVFKVDSEDSKEIKMTVSDNKGKSASKVYTIKIERQNLIGKLKASKTVGFDPLMVEFDASITKLNDPTDEVVYFTWDFGDGEVRKNTSVGKITHTYTFDMVKENGEFQPKVTLKTRKGLSQTILYPEKIVVKRQIKTFDILIPSHPAQLAHPGDKVDFAIQADGKIIGVTRDFGNGKKLTGQGREFSEANMTYMDQGTYEIFATVEFSDHPPVTQSIKLKIE